MVFRNDFASAISFYPYCFFTTLLNVVCYIDVRTNECEALSTLLPANDGNENSSIVMCVCVCTLFGAFLSITTAAAYTKDECWTMFNGITALLKYFIYIRRYTYYTPYFVYAVVGTYGEGHHRRHRGASIAHTGKLYIHTHWDGTMVT